MSEQKPAARAPQEELDILVNVMGAAKAVIHPADEIHFRPWRRERRRAAALELWEAIEDLRDAIVHARKLVVVINGWALPVNREPGKAST